MVSSRLGPKPINEYIYVVELRMLRVRKTGNIKRHVGGGGSGALNLGLRLEMFC